MPEWYQGYSPDTKEKDKAESFATNHGLKIEEGTE